MPSLADLTFLSGSGVLIGLVITASLVVLIADWRLALFALGIQYVLLGVLLTGVVQPPVATIRVISGGMACAILYFTMRYRASQDRLVRFGLKEPLLDARGHPIPPDVFTMGLSFRLFAVAFVAVAIIGLASSMTMFNLPQSELFSSLWLMAIGVLISMLSRDALRLGLGILVFTGGFGILDTAMESSLFLYGLINIADLLIALVVAHLATLASESSAGRRRGDQP